MKRSSLLLALALAVTASISPIAAAQDLPAIDERATVAVDDDPRPARRLPRAGRLVRAQGTVELVFAQGMVLSFFGARTIVHLRHPASVERGQFVRVRGFATDASPASVPSFFPTVFPALVLHNATIER